MLQRNDIQSDGVGLFGISKGSDMCMATSIILAKTSKIKAVVGINVNYFKSLFISLKYKDRYFPGFFVEGKLYTFRVLVQLAVFAKLGLFNFPDQVMNKNLFKNIGPNDVWAKEEGILEHLAAFDKSVMDFTESPAAFLFINGG